jgi:hypothetical protein
MIARIAPALVAVTSLLACSGAYRAEIEDTKDGGEAPIVGPPLVRDGGVTTADAADGAAPSDAGTCTAATGASACHTCAADQCCPEILACRAVADCGGLDTCLVDCGGDTFCGEQCEQQFAAGKQPLLKLYACANYRCTAACQ